MVPIILTLIAVSVIASVWAVRRKAQAGLDKAFEALHQNRLSYAEKRFRALIHSLAWGRSHELAHLGLIRTLEALDRPEEALEVCQRYREWYERTGRRTETVAEQIRERRAALNTELADVPVGIRLMDGAARPVPRARPVQHRSTEPRIRLLDSSEERNAPRIHIQESGEEKPKIAVRARRSESGEIGESGESVIDGEVSLPDVMLDGHRPERSDRVLDKYLIADKLGEGGFGEVYQAYLPVAIKVAKNPDLIENLRRLGTLQGKVKSPRIVAPLEVNLEHDPPYVVMEHVDGPTMRSLLDAYDRLEPAEAVALIHEIALGLEDAHEAGILHLDLKPENVLLTSDGQLKLTDFELGRDQKESARFRHSLSMESVDEDSLQGTVAYMSPEQRFGKELDERSDIYTAGVMFFEALTKELPQPGDKPSDFIANLPAEVDRIFERCFVRHDRRYRKVTDLVADLENLLAIFPERPDLAALVTGLREAALAQRQAAKAHAAERAVEAVDPEPMPITPPTATQEEPAAPPAEPQLEVTANERRPSLDQLLEKRADAGRQRERRPSIDELVKRIPSPEETPQAEGPEPTNDSRDRALEVDG